MSGLHSPVARFSFSILLLFLLAFVLVLSREALLPVLVQETTVVSPVPPPVGDDGGPGRDPAVGDSGGAALDSSWLWPEQTGMEGSPENAWKAHNQRTLKALHACVGTHLSCPPNQLKVIILQDNDYRRAFVGSPGGEKIWSRSVLRAFDQLGYSYLFAADPHLVASFYSLFPDLIRATIMNKEVLEACWENADGDCLKTGDNPLGLPIEQLFCPEFFGHNGGSPLGPQWSLSPEPFRHQPIRYLGYSIEDECTLTPIVPHAQRLRRVWVLAKQYHYFTSDRFPYSADIFVKASKAMNVEFVGAFDYEGKPGRDVPGVRNLGQDGHSLPKDIFEDEVRKSLAIVGVFDPVISPTPWYGLCWGLPFINPGNYRYDASGALEHISDSQHEFAALEGEPHVYNVNRGDDEGFIDALRRALSNPQERYIPRRMTERALRDRIAAWVDTDSGLLLQDVLHQDATGDLARRLRDKGVFLNTSVRK